MIETRFQKMTRQTHDFYGKRIILTLKKLLTFLKKECPNKNPNASKTQKKLVFGLVSQFLKNKNNSLKRVKGTALYASLTKNTFLFSLLKETKKIFFLLLFLSPDFVYYYYYYFSELK